MVGVGTVHARGEGCGKGEWVVRSRMENGRIEDGRMENDRMENDRMEDGEYILVHSTHDDEISNPNWTNDF